MRPAFTMHKQYKLAGFPHHITGNGIRFCIYIVMHRECESHTGSGSWELYVPLTHLVK